VQTTRQFETIGETVEFEMTLVSVPNATQI